MSAQPDKSAPAGENWQHALVVRVGRIGDMVVVTPTIRALLEKYPHLRITVLTSAEGRRLLQNFDPRIEDIWVYNRRRFPAFLEKRRLAHLIGSRKFDLVLMLEDKASFLDLLRDVDYPVRRIASATGRCRHFGDRALSLVEDPGVHRHWARLPVAGEKVTQVREELATLGIGDDTVVVGLHPSYSGRGKRFFRNRRSEQHRVWPQARWGELARLVGEYARDTGKDIRIIVDLPEKEAAPLGEMMAAAEGNITLLTPPPDFERYKALLARMDVLVTPNSGPMHLAAALGTRVLALFSNWDPAECGPYVDPTSYIALRAEDTAHPEQGLAAITASEVFNAVQGLLRD